MHKYDGLAICPTCGRLVSMRNGTLQRHKRMKVRVERSSRNVAFDDKNTALETVAYVGVEVPCEGDTDTDFNRFIQSL